MVARDEGLRGGGAYFYKMVPKRGGCLRPRGGIKVPQEKADRHIQKKISDNKVNEMRDLDTP